MTRPQTEPWQEVLLRRYRSKGRSTLGPLQVQVATDYLTLMDEAAKRIDANRSTFIRRSVALVIARILDIDVRLVLQHCPEPKRSGHSSGLFKAEEFDLGIGIEKWCPHPGCDGGHLGA